MINWPSMANPSTVVYRISRNIRQQHRAQHAGWHQEAKLTIVMGIAFDRLTWPMMRVPRILGNNRRDREN